MAYLGSSAGKEETHEEMVYYIGDLSTANFPNSLSISGDNTDIKRIELLELRYRPIVGETNLDIINIAWENHRLGNSIGQHWSVISPPLQSDGVSYRMELNHPIILFDNKGGLPRHTSVPFNFTLRKALEFGYFKIRTEYVYARVKITKFVSSTVERYERFEHTILNEPT